MVSIKFVASSLFLASSALAHFRIVYPGERNATNWDTQTTGPCGGANRVVEPRFLFKPEGSPLELTQHHSLSIGQVRFCPGEDCNTQEDFSVILLDSFEQTGAGNFCVPALSIPYKTGTNGTIQVTYTGLGEVAGEYDNMYNCLDITVSDEGASFSGQCFNSSSSVISPIKLDSNVISNATNITVLDSYFSSTKSVAATASASSSSRDMAGMDMSGMDMSGMSGHSMTSSKAASATSSASNTSSTSVAGAAAITVGWTGAVALVFAALA
ncbi:hypothetical protein BABINDRAFT_72853 [Babjeviella inositovora NRRL Y-12698]|uniref:Copper acquisition factor BIM1-like domain-containing protein n=1 Tax=Babjeviella inositovora NRRL Y-12698 TaxID=984486 RepID=A0A1E3QXT5_9ASCO|nr:uncharacterized protein BABINDRAFT_72853 [Babjeviella inositovora NRRL Y-12698]ODQ82485.1 hypothetical protein BABINDRAFT_72853 [Babjeviella inositovora NRRL Y-12698]